MVREAVDIDFVKMTGAGNDFVLINNQTLGLQLDWQAVARSLCHRRYGIGADGLLVLEKSRKADFLMRYYNADGTDGGMCGNGGRCSALYAMQQINVSRITFEALGFIYSASAAENSVVKLSMKDPSAIQTNMSVPLQDSFLILHFIDSGAPHAVIFMDELAEKYCNAIARDGIWQLGKTIRHHPKFSPQGTNVDFVSLGEHGEVSIRTYERGVENETLACGTGCVATAVIMSLLRDIGPPLRVRTLSGECLAVSFSKKGEKISEVILEGPAVTVFTGRFRWMPAEELVKEKVI